MAQRLTVADRILDAVFQAPGCLLEELVLACPDLTWNQVFLEVDRLSRRGQVRLQLKGAGIYMVRLPERPDSERASVSRKRSS